MEERIRVVAELPRRDKGEYVLYWMQAAQRIRHNYALGYAISQANDLRKPLRVIFVLTAYPEANIRHYWFMIQGLSEVGTELKELGIDFQVFHGSPPEVVERFSKKAVLVVSEKAYLRTPRDWRRTLANTITCQYIEVETETVVPIETTSIKEEYAAATIRKKITSRWQNYLQPYFLPEYLAGTGKADWTDGEIRLASFSSSDLLSTYLNLSPSPKISPTFAGGYSHAIGHLRHFFSQGLKDFADRRSDPSLEIQSNLSPYLHFGQISSSEAALLALEFWKEQTGVEYNILATSTEARPDHPLYAFLEELIVRRELAFNFCYYNPNYDNYTCLPDWAKKTLANHSTDERSPLYTLEDLEQGKTYDPYWNACMKEGLITGKMAGYMRMYWAKKILEWSPKPEVAYSRILYLNNKYFLDGRDPNSYAGVAWCFGKHDRPWTERAIFGSVRYMNDKGLERKFKIKDYAAKWNTGELPENS
ncbi:MAG: deoxyribodipyrimidine photolyase [Spirochaetales bacterium]|nr:deoxyribodipyrimidine photolyase [Spirochaetales bacterium]